MILEMPEDTVAPLVLAVGVSVLFVGMLLKTLVIVATGVAVTAVSLSGVVVAAARAAREGA